MNYIARPLLNLLLIIFIIYFAKPIKARAQIIDSIHYGWIVYEYEDENLDEGKKCYIASFAKNSITSHTAKRNPYLIITRYAKNRTEEISIDSGYEYKINSRAYILIGDQQYTLFTEKNKAWFRRSEDDHIVIEQMLKTNIVRARSDSAIGTYAIDEYWMKGFPRAYLRMKELCQ